MTDSFPFGINNQRFVVLDKSFLDGVNSVQLQLYVQHGWTFGITEALMHEHFRKRDARRIANIFKLRSIEESLFMLPEIGEMFRVEAKELKPATTLLKAKMIMLSAKKGPSGEYFELDHDSLQATKEREGGYEKRCEDLIEAWRELALIGRLGEATSEEMPDRVHELSLRIRDDHDDMRSFYGNHRQPTFPAPELLNDNWTFFRWVQVQLLGGLSYFASYGVANKPSREKLMHELFDLMYLLSAVLVGGLACREKRFIERFRFLRPDGVLLRY